MTKKPVRSSAPASLKQLARFARTIRGRTMFIAVFGVLSAAVIIGAATSNVSSDKATTHAPSKTSSAAPAAAAGTVPAYTPTMPPAVGMDAAGPVATSGAKVAPVTITGCLERNDEGFRLKDTSGDNVPKARSWKSGFLKKGSASIEVIDAANRTKLGTHVGQRVSVTGILTDRQMQVRSVQRVAVSCSAKS